VRAKRSTLPPRRKFQPWVGEENLFLIIVSVLGHLKEIGGGGAGGGGLTSNFLHGGGRGGGGGGGGGGVNFQFPPWGRYGQITH
jgi:hypothetical protein